MAVIKALAWSGPHLPFLAFCKFCYSSAECMMQFLPMSSCSRVDSSCLITFIPICRKFLVFADVLATCTFKYWLTMTPLHTWAILRYTSQTHHKHRSLTQDSFPPDPFVVPQACSAIPELRVLVYHLCVLPLVLHNRKLDVGPIPWFGRKENGILGTSGFHGPCRIATSLPCCSVYHD